MTMNFSKIAVHNFVFHADDVVSVAALSVLYKHDPEVLRVSSRDGEAQEKARQDGFVLLDVGGGELDHHSVEARNNAYTNGVIKSALGKVLDQAVRDSKISGEETEVLLMNGLYDLQARDNGQDFAGVASPFGFVHWLNGPNPADDHDQAWRFKQAVNMAKQVFSAMVEDAKKASPEHEECLKAFEVMGGDGIADFPHHMGHSVLECQMWNAAHPDREVRFFTFPGRDGFMIQAVNKVGSFELNHALPHAGLRNEALNEAAGITDGIFVHPNGFIGSAETIESCHKIAGK